jgi:hypothetical protein
MSIKQQIIDRLDRDNPETCEILSDGSRRDITGKERADLLATWADNEINHALADMRSIRDGLLAASDWTQVPDAPVDAKAWAAYRQALRDLPATIDEPTAEVEWPTPPE